MRKILIDQALLARIPVIFALFLLFIVISLIAYKIDYKKYFLLSMFIFTLLMGSALETIGLFAPNLVIAKKVYKLAAISFTFTFFILAVYFADEFKNKFRDFLFSVTSFYLTFELYFTITYDPIVEKSLNYWILLTVRPIQAYFSRTIMTVIIGLSIFYYSIRQFMRTKLLKRKVISLIFSIVLLSNSLLNVYTLIAFYPYININIIIYTEYVMAFLFLSIVIIDPYFFVFWTGKITTFLVYREGGILVYNYDVTPSKKVDRLLISSFLSAISGFGAELIFEETNLNSLEFEKFSVKIVNHKKFYMAIVGTEISPKIDVFAKKFLEEISGIIEESTDIVSFTKEDYEKIDELFRRLIVQIVL